MCYFRGDVLPLGLWLIRGYTCAAVTCHDLTGGCSLESPTESDLVARAILPCSCSFCTAAGIKTVFLGAQRKGGTNNILDG